MLAVIASVRSECRFSHVPGEALPLSPTNSVSSGGIAGSPHRDRGGAGAGGGGGGGLSVSSTGEPLLLSTSLPLYLCLCLPSSHSACPPSPC